ncbi:hypothetical protein P7L54_20800 [Acinetobacter bereziniae]|uniref:HK97 gp10 family phage protein n=1 Tax=Acinetobacter bereziniae LMG 1003 = CIP 70.12 TaxID=981324 RepID=N9ETM9_ACIBZ|nr:hypothetical protein [Acinetobacter bereziniae]ENV98294.1 hypothetical protein F938_01148 [Acinetobacter bereziniae LMG 1003 = CIP 70.12]MBJ9908557.1 hypothetical protein [Acinetobacter bereziniae]MBJ9929866.1 hypothetical protein [Acinetobacter bereziniae]MDG3558381.1 hypothetical protein [Acinetobacter bereziniae]MDP6003538.1 hypothetical protein [Acinetobacter bereziniae]
MVDSVDVHIQLNEENNRVKVEIRRTITALTLKLQRMVQEDMLSGQRLNVQSGRLRGSLASKVEESGGVIEGIVSAGGAHVKYAFIHEFGLSGSIGIKEHMRHIKQAFGRPITPRDVLVKAHSRNVNVKEKRFMRDSLDEIAKIVPKDIDKAIERGLNG